MPILTDRRPRGRLLLSFFALALVACNGEPVPNMNAASTTQVIRGATVLTGERLTPILDGVVVIRDRAIVAVGARAEIPIPEGARIVDASGQTLMPGFIDAHVHIGFYEPADVLAGGVTTVRDLAWPPARITGAIARSEKDGFDGPTIIAAGPMLTVAGGYPTRAGWAPPGTGREVAGLADARTAVAEVADAGFSVVKIALNPPAGPVLDPDTLSAIVASAHEHGLKVTGHIHGLDQLEKAIDAGVDELAHMLMSDEAIPAETIQRMVQADMTVVPTLAVFSGHGLRTAIANLEAFRTAGGRVVYGTDLGNAGPRPGIDPNEVARMHRAGMTGADIIRSATVESAAWLRLSAVGQIADGMDADLVLVDGNPLTDPSALIRVTSVWRRGLLMEQ